MARLRLGTLALFAVVAFGVAARAEFASYERSPLVIDTIAGPRPFFVELARTPEQQQLGLMFRRSMPPEAGMLFDFGESRRATFWMKNTLIPLDMVFIAADGRVAEIHEHAVPLSEAAIESGVAVRAVLEVNANIVAQLGIRVGDLVHHPIFGNSTGS